MELVQWPKRMIVSAKLEISLKTLEMRGFLDKQINYILPTLLI